MSKAKKLPKFAYLIIDLVFIAVYVLGFYGLNYLLPRELESENVTTTITSTSTTEDDEDQSASLSSLASGDESESATDWSEKFSDYFTESITTTSNSYSSSNISITIEKYTTGSGSDIVTYYVADIYIADIECLQSGFADDTYGVSYTDYLLNMDEEFNAILAMNGDYYGNGSNGVVIRNGEVYRSSTNGADVCVLYYDGTMVTYSAAEFDVDEAISNGAWQAWCFGPELLDDSGESMTSFTASSHVTSSNPRSAIGYYEPGHYCMVLVDGRQNGYSTGMNLSELSQLFEDLGCSAAYNLDGGKSSSMTFDDELVNQPASGGREVSDCIFITEVN